MSDQIDQECRFERGSGCLTHSSMLSTALPTLRLCDIGLAALQAEVNWYREVLATETTNLLRDVLREYRAWRRAAR